MILILFPIVAIAIGAYVKYQKDVDIREIENKEAKALVFEDNKITCPQCFMYLVGKKDTVQAIDKQKHTHFFDDVGCLIEWTKEKNIDINSLILWAYTRDSKEYIDMRKAFYAINSKTPMGYGFSAYKKKKEGYIDFDEMRVRMLRGEHLLNPKIRKRILQK